MTYDAIIVGAGPAGLACAVECRRNGLKALVLEKGTLVDAIYRFPANMIFFTTSDLLEIGDVPFTTTNPKPTREEGLNYYKRVVQHYGLEIQTGNRVTRITKTGDLFQVDCEAHSGSGAFQSRFVIVATGYYDTPNRLGVPGEDSDKVSHYYTDPHPYYDKDVLIIGGKNSACIAALELYRYGARVTVVHRREEVKASVKYWILPDFLNRVNEKAIALLLDSEVSEIKARTVAIVNRKTGVKTEIPNDFVFALTGYRPNEKFLTSAGIELSERLVPSHDNETMATNVSGLYVAGSVSAGLDTNKLFIENGRFHGKTIVADMLRKIRS